MIAADLLQDIDFPFAKNFFSGTGIELGNGHAHSPFNTPVRIDKLPAEALGQLAANMTFAIFRFIIIGAPPLLVYSAYVPPYSIIIFSP